MRIGVISDTHGSLHYFNKAMDFLGPCDYIIHCGDLLPPGSKAIEGGYDPEALAKRVQSLDHLFLVEGNGDFYSKTLTDCPFHKELFLELGDYKIFATHSHLFSRMSMLMRAEERGATILCYGHTHAKELDYYENLLILNPGSTTLPRDGSRSCAIIENHCVSIFDIDTKVKLAYLSLKS